MIENPGSSSRTTDPLPRERVTELCDRLREALAGAVLGQAEAVDSLLCAYLAGGHALLEGVPGIGKTLLARSLAAALGVRFGRIQFTPDLMPTDVIGTNVFDPSSRAFQLTRGPVFTDFLMADEINRTPPKTQSALLEAMQEIQVTIDGERHPLETGFFVIATQNPVEFEGTYPLPEAQLDRFLLRIEMSLPDAQAELELFRRAVAGTLKGWSERAATLEPVTARDEALALRGAAREIHVSEELLGYLGALAAAVRASPHLELGISPRGALALLETARAAALLAGRDFVAPDDLKRFLIPCWGHRLLLTAEAIVDEAAGAVEIPR
jgi:MoxR-like ATPase